MNELYTCMHCGKALTKGIYDFSMDVYEVPLCLKHQIWLKESHASSQAKHLFLALKYKQLPVELEYHDGKKTIDIALPGKLYIEVDGKYHYNADQALSDLLRNNQFINDDQITTIKVPNSLVENPYLFDMAVDCITEMYRNIARS